MSKADLEKAFANVIRAPHDDVARLAFADAVENVGDHARAEFVRLQVESARLARRHGSFFADPGWRRSDELLQRNRQRWAGEIGTRVSWLDFFRGFVEAVKIDAQQLVVSADELFSLAPLRRLIVTHPIGVMPRLVNMPQLEQIVYLVLDGDELTDEDALLLAGSKYVGALKWLDFSRNKITANGVEAIAASNAFPSLIKLELGGTPACAIREEIGTDYDQSVQSGGPSEAGLELERKYGRQAWLNFEVSRRAELSHEEL